jgi:hypothetical protein
MTPMLETPPLLRGLTSLALAVTLCGCAAKTSLLRFSGSPDDALVTINDRYIGKLGRLEKAGVLLEAGEYRVTIEQVGYFPQDQVVVIENDVPPSPIQVELTEIPD